MMRSRSREILFALLAVSIGAVWMAPDPPEIVEPIAPTQPKNRASAADSSSDVAAQARSVPAEKPLAVDPRSRNEAYRRELGAFAAGKRELFSHLDLAPKTAVPVLPPMPVRAAPPPIPLRALGRMLDDDGEVVFVETTGKVLPTRVGDVLQSVYRIDAIEARLVRLTYLPLNEQQSLPIGR